MVQLQLLEEKNNVQEKTVIRKIKPEEKHITLSNSIEEVHHKGTLMERLEMLEKLVLQFIEQTEMLKNKMISFIFVSLGSF